MLPRSGECDSRTSPISEGGSLTSHRQVTAAACSPPRRLVPRLRPSQREGEINTLLDPKYIREGVSCVRKRLCAYLHRSDTPNIGLVSESACIGRYDQRAQRYRQKKHRCRGPTRRIKRKLNFTGVYLDSRAGVLKEAVGKTLSGPFILTVGMNRDLRFPLFHKHEVAGEK